MYQFISSPSKEKLGEKEKHVLEVTSSGDELFSDYYHLNHRPIK